MSKYDGLIIPRSYNEYINKTDPVAMSQALQLNNVLAQEVAAGNNKAVTSNAVNNTLANLTGVKVTLKQDANECITNTGTTRYFYCPSSALHIPTVSGAYIGWNIEVLNGASNYRCTQIAYSTNADYPYIYTRTTNDGVNFTNWVRVANESDLNKYSTPIAIGKTTTSDNIFNYDFSDLKTNEIYSISFTGSYARVYHYYGILFNGNSNRVLITMSKTSNVNEPTIDNKIMTFTWNNDPAQSGIDYGIFKVTKINL